MAFVAQLHLYPIKSCAGIALQEAVLGETGLMHQLLYDREWMVVDAEGNFLTQRTHPRLALIQPRIRADVMALRAPGMLTLEVPLAMPDPEDAAAIAVQVWGDRVSAYDCDPLTASWFSNFLGLPCRLARFHAKAQRIANKEWTAGVEARTMFADGYPLLVISESSLDDVNTQLLRHGRAALPMNRFRPNIVLGGVNAYEEDYAETLRIGDTMLKLVKPCPRCPIPSVDQATGTFGPDPLDIMRHFRVNAKLDGRISFGMNAIVLEGEGQTLRVGQSVDVELAF
jgi:uncharacterized protein